MKFNLQQHRADPVEAGIVFEAGLEPKQNKLILNYHISGQTEDLILPEPKKQIERLDNLWQNSCFEAFFRFKDSTNYLELNLSPFSAYNAYFFDSYRQGMREYDIAVPRLSATKEKNYYSFQAQIDNFDIKRFSELSITAILKFKTGEISHWAINHLADKANFHLFDSFVRL